jgi:hypothetical protein
MAIKRELGIKGLPGPKKCKKNLVNQATALLALEGSSDIVWAGTTSW